MAVKFKTKTLDCYLVGDIFIFLSVMLFVKGKIANSFFVSLLGLLFYICGTSIIKSRVYNATGGVMFAMDENDHENIMVIPDGETAINVDGINVGGTIYKIPDGVQATITQNGIRIISAMGNLVYFVSGGKKKSLPEPSWEKLFNAHLS